MDVWRLGHRPALDGLRGIAVILVLIAHSHVPLLETAGPVGVTIFFTLSGFLISSLLLAEHERIGAIRLGRFYRRRALRLFPALATCIAVVALIGAVVPAFATTRDVIAASTHLSNWVMVVVPEHYIGALSHTWSLATEEQFYLLWPLLLVALLPRFGERGVLIVAIIGSIASTLERWWLWNDGLGEWRIYFGADTHADALLVGCALAVLMRRHGSRHQPILALLLLTATSALSFATGFAAGVIVPTLVPLMTAGVIACVVDGSRALTWNPLRLVGQRSYGLYLWHYPVAILVELAAGRAWLPQLLIMVPTAWLLTLISWHFVEQPFLRLKDKTPESADPAFEPAHGRTPEQTPALVST